jgi:hypothetical protein
MCELKAWVMMRIYIDSASNATCLKLVIQFVNLVIESFVISNFVENRDQDCLDLGHTWRQHETRIVRVDHDHASDRARGQPPGCLVHECLLFVLVRVPDVEHLRKVLAQMM